jgi:two-component sensor histidine kinase
VTDSEGANALLLRWYEIDGPKVVTPTRQGGSQIVRDLIESVGGSVEMEFQEDGLIVTAIFPL